MIGVGFTIIPFSWVLDSWFKPHKTIFGLGPFRLSIHWHLPPWKSSI